LLDPQFHVGDPHPAYTWMRVNEPVYHDVNGIWCVTRMDDVRDVERRPGEFTSSRGYRSTWFPEETSMISEDDPRHHDQRAQIADLFSRRAMVTLEPAIRAIVAEALDHLGGIGLTGASRSSTPSRRASRPKSPVTSSVGPVIGGETCGRGPNA